MKDKFNRYCAEVMGYMIAPDHSIVLVKDRGYFLRDFYEDLNDMVEVVEKLLTNTPSCGVGLVAPINIKQAFRDFIISTMPAGEDDEKQKM